MSTLAEQLTWKFVFQHFNCRTWCCRPGVISSSPQSRLYSNGGLCSIHQGVIKLNHLQTDTLCRERIEMETLSHIPPEQRRLGIFTVLGKCPSCPFCCASFESTSSLLPETGWLNCIPAVGPKKSYNCGLAAEPPSFQILTLLPQFILNGVA